MGRHVKNNIDFGKIRRVSNQMMKSGIDRLGSDIQRRAVVLAPVESGKLRSSATKRVEASGRSVVVGFYTPYARRRHYENKKHPSSKYYLQNALKSIKDVSRYFDKI